MSQPNPPTKLPDLEGERQFVVTPLGVWSTHAMVTQPEHYEPPKLTRRGRARYWLYLKLGIVTRMLELASRCLYTDAEWLLRLSVRWEHWRWRL
jgi:hypothetical protein